MDKNKFAVSTYDKVAKSYADQYFTNLSDASRIDNFLSLLPQNASVLDVGSGPGQFTKCMLEKGFIVEGIDLSKEMIRIAKKRVPYGKFTVMDMRNLTYPDASFDGLLVAYSLIHIPSIQISSTLIGFHRVLKPGGKMIVIVQKGKQDQIVDEPLKEGEQTFINFFSKKRLSQLLSKTGFKIVSIKEAPSSDPDDLSDTVIYAIAKRPVK